MPVLIATAKAANANAYVAVARADLILGRRLYTAKWDAATSTPDAEGYLVNDPTSTLAPGATSVPIDTGAGTFSVGCKIQFAGDTTIYTVGTKLSTAGTLAITPALVAAPANDSLVTRLTANDKEKALIWATTIFDSLMTWYGSPTTQTQGLRHPRTGIVNADGYAFDRDIIAPILEVSTAEYGLVLLERNKMQLPGILGQGISSARLGPLEVTVDGKQIEDAIPQNILAMLSDLGYLENEAQTGSRIVPLWRA